VLPGADSGVPVRLLAPWGGPKVVAAAQADERLVGRCLHVGGRVAQEVYERFLQVQPAVSDGLHGHHADVGLLVLKAALQLLRVLAHHLLEQPIKELLAVVHRTEQLAKLLAEH
jgi:hypothetical protein